nr:hypothetical protein Iba_scaffold50925CG0010 [Ipomoea batatas]
MTDTIQLSITPHCLLASSSWKTPRGLVSLLLLAKLWDYCGKL